MALITEFTDIALSDLLNVANEKRISGWRAVQMLCVNTEDGVDMTYSFSKDGVVSNYRVKGITENDKVPSLQGQFLGLFPFENEAVDLFGVKVEGMVLDFAGQFYQLAQKQPMTIITPEQKAAREKAKKIAAAKAAKEGAPEEQAAPAAQEAPKADAPARKAASKVQGSSLADLVQSRSYQAVETKLASLGGEKAQMVRKAFEARGLHAKPERATTGEAVAEEAQKPAVEKKSAAASKAKTPEQIEAMISKLDPEKQKKVREALERQAQKRAAAGKDGE